MFFSALGAERSMPMQLVELSLLDFMAFAKEIEDGLKGQGFVFAAKDCGLRYAKGESC